MTANDVALAVRNGEADPMELWEAIRRFAYSRARKWEFGLVGRGGLTMDDLIQCAFIAMLSALPGWDQERCSFLTWYDFYLKTEFSTAAGLRTKRDKFDPLRTAVSLNTPLDDGEEESAVLEDTVPDPRATAALDAIAENDFEQRQAGAISEALEQLPDDLKEIVELRYFQNKTRTETGEILKLPEKTVKKLEETALFKLRHPSISKRLYVYMPND